MSLPEHYISIDEDGFPLSGGEVRITDEVVGAQILSTLTFAENKAFQAEIGTATALVEAFDDPLVAHLIEAPHDSSSENWTAQFPYQVTFHFALESLTVDEWDRFHGLTEKGIPFVFSRKAQAAFFDLLEEFDDDSITFRGKQFEMKPWMSSNPDIRKESYWSEIYRTEEPGWELNCPSPILVDMLPRLKLPKSRILVLGCGSGNDAAFFAEQGHVVTGLDFSPEALRLAREKYGHLSNLKFIEKDVFALDASWNQQFDIVFEHTCYCAIPPERRNELVGIWKRVLVHGGQLFGVFFAMEKRSGPPFGGTEWELRERLKKHFQFQFWGRWNKSIQRRNGKELFVYGTKKD